MKLVFNRVLNWLKMAFYSFKKLMGLGVAVVKSNLLVNDENLAPLEDRPMKKPRPVILPPAPEKRNEILTFIIEKLRPYVDQNKSQIREIHLHLRFNSPEEELLLKVALYHGEIDWFKEQELHPALSNYYISVSKNWIFQYYLTSVEIPETCTFKADAIGLNIIQNLHDIKVHPEVKLNILVGQADQNEYFLDVGKQLVYLIGRGKKPILATGHIRTNDIAFWDTNDTEFDSNQREPNSSISRNHANIKFDPAQQKYFLYSEVSSSGGVNKTKLLKLDGRIERVSLATLRYELSDGDQIQLGDTAIIEFKLI